MPNPSKTTNTPMRMPMPLKCGTPAIERISSVSSNCTQIFAVVGIRHEF